MTIPAFDLKRQTTVIANDVLLSIQRVLDSSQFILGNTVKDFEETIGRYIGASAIGVANGSDALYLALLALNIGRGDEVITTPFTFFATAGSILRTGAKPVFSDIQLDTFNMDPDLASAHVTPRTRAMLPVHLFGLMADLPQLAAHFDGPIVEDAAQAIGASWNHRAAGTAGILGCFSFFPTKNLGAYGDAGLVSSRNPELLQQVRHLRVHGSSKKYVHEMLGINSRLDAMQAAVLSVKLPYLPAWTRRRQAIATLYDSLFRHQGIEEVTVPVVPSEAVHVYHQYTIRAMRRDDLMSFLKQRGIGSTVYYPVPLHLQPILKDLGYRRGDFPVSEKASEEVLSLPMFPELTDDEVTRVVDTIGEFYGHSPRR